MEINSINNVNRAHYANPRSGANTAPAKAQAAKTPDYDTFDGRMRSGLYNTLKALEGRVKTEDKSTNENELEYELDNINKRLRNI